MDLNRFIEFPGILISIGVILLIVSIIIGILAYKKEEKEISADDLDIEKPDIKIPEKEVIKEINKEKEEKTFEFPAMEEIKEKKTSPKLEEIIIPDEIKKGTNLYGGNDPSEKINLDFNNKKRYIYGQALKDEPDEKPEIVNNDDIELL